MDGRANRYPNTAITLDAYVRVKGAREYNRKNIDLNIPWDAFVVFTGVSGSGKSSLAFGSTTQIPESVSPYARRLFYQMAVPEVDEIEAAACRGASAAACAQTQARAELSGHLYRCQVHG
jgi:excinuclease UvrABC ATPase subunit